MILKLKYYGMIAEAVGKENENIEFSASTVIELDEVLKKQYNKLTTMNYKIAVNQSIAQVELELNDNDEIALLPPFAGG